MFDILISGLFSGIHNFDVTVLNKTNKHLIVEREYGIKIDSKNIGSSSGMGVLNALPFDSCHVQKLHLSLLILCVWEPIDIKFS